MFYYLFYTTFLIIGSYSLAILFGILTVKQIRQDIALQSPKTRQLQTQFNRILLIQSTIPFLLTTIPMSTVVLTAFMNINTGQIGTLIMMAISWIPFFNSLTSILLIAPYRQWLFKICMEPTRVASLGSDVQNTSKGLSNTINTRSLSVEINR